MFFLPLFPLSVLQAVGSCPVPFIVKFLAAFRWKVNRGNEDNCFLKINIYFILLWYGLVAMETAEKSFCSVDSTGGGAACLRHREFKCAAMGAEREKDFVTPELLKPLFLSRSQTMKHMLFAHPTANMHKMPGVIHNLWPFFRPRYSPFITT